MVTGKDLVKWLQMHSPFLPLWGISPLKRIKGKHFPKMLLGLFSITQVHSVRMTSLDFPQAFIIVLIPMYPTVKEIKRDDLLPPPP